MDREAYDVRHSISSLVSNVTEGRLTDYETIVLEIISFLADCLLRHERDLSCDTFNVTCEANKK